MINIDDIIRQIDELEPIPRIAHQVIALANDPGAAVADLIRMVEYEPAITANLLRICNSAYFGFAMPIESVRHAVSLLGFDQIVELVLLSASCRHLNRTGGGGVAGGIDLWQQTVTSAVIARTMAHMLNFEDRQLVFTGALLKDIGRVILDRYAESHSNKIMELMNVHNYSIVAAEREVLGTDHAAVGALIAEKWKFTPSLAFIIANHHLPDDEATGHTPSAIVYLADTLCLQIVTDTGSDWADDFFNATVIESLNLSAKDLQQLQIQCWEIQEKTEALGLVR